MDGSGESIRSKNWIKVAAPYFEYIQYDSGQLTIKKAGLEIALFFYFAIVDLTGVVVNDVILLIERVIENIAEGMLFFDT